MRRKAPVCVLLLLLTLTVWAQEYNSVPLGHAAYGIIELGVIRALILPPPSAKPWPVNTIREKLREITYSGGGLSEKEMDAVIHVLDSFERKNGFHHGRYRAETRAISFEAGFGWESRFSVEAPGASLASVNLAKMYMGGDIEKIISWNVAALGGLLYIEREEAGSPDRSVLTVPAAFPYTLSNQWDGGVLSLVNPQAYSAWPDDPSLAYALEGEINGILFDRLLQLRLGRIRHDWGPGANGASLFFNSNARPFLAFEGLVSPLPWMHISFLNGALEYYREEGLWPDGRPFNNMLSALQFEVNPWRYVHFGIGGSAVWFQRIDWALFANLELRLPWNFKLWGSLFIDRLNPAFENFYVNGNSYAFQAGIKAAVSWLPFGAFTLRYTKIEPYCYSYYLPPNSDEFLMHLESALLPNVNAHVQFQILRHGADFGYGAVGGSSLRDKHTDPYAAKYFIMDGVYRWENVFKLGASWDLKTEAMPLTFFAETGIVGTRFTINGTAGTGNEADYEPLSDSVYHAGNRFIFTLGFRLFS